METLKAIWNLKRIREFVMKHGIGAYGAGFNLNWSDGRGQWVATISIPIPKGNDIGTEEFEGIGDTWQKAVNLLAGQTKPKEE